MATFFDPPHPLSTPVLFLIFSRMGTAKQVLSVIRKAKPPRFYIAADGPREGCPGEDKKVNDVREYVLKNIDWNCEIKTLFRDKNLGCKHAVSDAITWFFESENQGIILEDDTLPTLSFFWFCEELLEKYKEDERIMAIGGINCQREMEKGEDSYYFSKYNHCWGWATWRRAWQYYDRDMIRWPRAKQEGALRYLADSGSLFMRYWRSIFDCVSQNKIDTWDYAWTFSCWIQNGLTCLPHVNLVTNIGFGRESTHTKDCGSRLADFPRREIRLPLSHPEMLVRNVRADRWTDRYWFKISLFSAVKAAVTKMPGVLYPAAKFSLLLQRMKTHNGR